MFISLEGIEGSGKTTQLNRLAVWLEAQGRAVCRTREPGATDLGRKLRTLLLDTRQGSIESTAELFLFLADRAQHVNEVIRPALAANKIVLCDRFQDSTIVYQGCGRGLPQAMLESQCLLAAGDLQPQLTLLLDLEPSLGLERAGKRNADAGITQTEGRFEGESLAFHKRIRDGYLALARKNPERISIIDARTDRDEVFAQCRTAVTKMLEEN